MNPLDRFRRLAMCPPGTRFKFERPAWSVSRVGVVIGEGMTPGRDPVPCMVVRLDPLPDMPETPPVNWHPDVFVEVIPV